MVTTAATTKRVRLVSDKPPKEFTVEIVPSDTPRNVLEKAGLEPDDYHVLKPGDQSYFELTEAVWDSAPEGGKLHIIMKSTVGMWGIGTERRAASAAPLSTYTQDLGWKSNTRGRLVEHRGHFRALGLSWPGFVVQDGPRLYFFIHRPPIGLIRRTEWAGCFHPSQQGDGWFAVTFKPNRVPATVASGIADINVTLKKVYQLTRPR